MEKKTTVISPEALQRQEGFCGRVREYWQAQRAGLQICTLGSRILRCETAPLCALSALMYAAGEF